MRRLHTKVNIVPIIAKADTLTATEIKKLKQTILEEIEENKIQVNIKISVYMHYSFNYLKS